MSWRCVLVDLECRGGSEIVDSNPVIAIEVPFPRRYKQRAVLESVTLFGRTVRSDFRRRVFDSTPGTVAVSHMQFVLPDKSSLRIAWRPRTSTEIGNGRGSKYAEKK